MRNENMNTDKPESTPETRAGKIPLERCVIPECICAGNLRNIVAETSHLIGKKFEDADGKRYVYFGVVYGDDDLYYGMSDMENKCLLLSCVGSLGMFGFEEV